MIPTAPQRPRTGRRASIFLAGVIVAAALPLAIRNQLLGFASTAASPTAFDAEVPGVGNLHPALLDALRRATSEAAEHGVELVVTSGWRSRDEQEQLLEEAIGKYGSVEEATRWVATPDTSAHVSGDAVDIGAADGAAWLSHHGARYGLCRIYSNEPWHFELRPDAAEMGCPAPYADATMDPRMHP